MMENQTLEILVIYEEIISQSGNINIYNTMTIIQKVVLSCQKLSCHFTRQCTVNQEVLLRQELNCHIPSMHCHPIEAHKARARLQLHNVHHFTVIQEMLTRQELYCN